MSYAIKHGYTNTCKVALDFLKCLTAAGYVLKSVDGVADAVLPSSTSFEGEDASPTFMAVVENSIAVDPCADTQKWRMRIEAKAGFYIRIHQATDKQISDIGDTIEFPGSAVDLEMCELQKGGTRSDIKNYFFTYETLASKAVPAAAPLSMICVIAKHGLSLCIWVEGQDNVGTAFTWFTTQRGIQSDGAPWITKKAPLWTVFSVGGGGVGDVDAPVAATAQSISQFVVCESDVHAPTSPQHAEKDWADSTRLFNVHQQVSITEDEKFNLSVPRDLTTQRYFYPLEMDLIGYSSADVISQYSEAPVRMYGEDADRVYKALNANAKNNKGMRILFLVKQDDKLIDISNALA